MYSRSTIHPHFTRPGEMRHQENLEREQEKTAYALGNPIRKFKVAGRRIIPCLN